MIIDYSHYIDYLITKMYSVYAWSSDVWLLSPNFPSPDSCMYHFTLCLWVWHFLYFHINENRQHLPSVSALFLPLCPPASSILLPMTRCLSHYKAIGDTSPQCPQLLSLLLSYCPNTYFMPFLSLPLAKRKGFAWLLQTSDILPGS